MSRFDVALGLTASVLDQGAAGLYADPQAREKLFKGSMGGKLAGIPYTVGWDVQAAPTFVLGPPDAAHWSAAVDSTGVTNPVGSQPPADTFQILMSAFEAQYTLGSAAPVGGTAAVQIYGTVGIVPGATAGQYVAKLTPVAVWLDESGFTGWDKFFVNAIIGIVLTMAQKMLSGWTIPALSFSRTVSGITVAIELAEPPVAAIDQSLLLVAANLKSQTAPVDIRGATWPTQPLFALVSQGVLGSIGSQISGQLKGKQLSGSGDYKKLLTYDYSATMGVLTVTTHPEEMTKLTASVTASFDATVKPLGIGGPCAISAAGSNL